MNQSCLLHFHTGSALFNCYLNNPELTKKTFVTIGNEIYMKTGDLARYNALGELVPAGRLDFQIKIRGQRVETSEIESTIMNWQSPDGTHDEISNCLVVKFLDDEDSLVAYIISSNLQLNIDSIRVYCQTHLRQFMVPSYFIVLDKMPLNSNGKVDRKQLPHPRRSQTNSNSIQAKSLDDKVRQLWCSLLDLDNLPDDDTTTCFALGGSSLTLMRIFNHYQFYLTPHRQLNVLDFFAQPTIVQHIRLLTALDTSTTSEEIAPVALQVCHAVQGKKEIGLIIRKIQRDKICSNDFS
jgi:hypothetical protein